MKLSIKAALAALAVASLAGSAANAAIVVTTTTRPAVVVEHRDVCVRGCFRHHSLRAEFWRHQARIDRMRAHEAREAFLIRRGEMAR